jgi:hypothetical protein
MDPGLPKPALAAVIEIAKPVEAVLKLVCA